MKHQVIALSLQNGCVVVDGIKTKINLPEGCTGLFFCFESKKAARKYWGKDVDLIRIELKKKLLKHKGGL